MEITTKSLHGLKFSNAADALLTNLFMEHEFTVKEATKTLEVLRDVDFHQRELSLLSISDAYEGDRVQNVRLKGQTKDSGTTSFGGTAGIPSVILDLVLQYFSNMRLPFHHVAEDFKKPPTCQSTKTLFNMCLVHPSWSLLSQRALASRVHVHGVEGIQKALASVAIGPWTRELLFTCATNRDIEEDFDGESPSQILPYLTALLNKLRNVQLLSVWTYFDEYNFDIGLMRNFLQSLKRLERLKRLWLSHVSFSGKITRGTNPSLAELCLVLPELPSLESLYLKDWSIPARAPLRYIYPTQTYIHIPEWKLCKYNCPPPPIDVTPPRSLKLLKLRWSAREEYPLRHIGWLLRSRGEYSLQGFALSMQANSRDASETDEAVLGDEGSWDNAADYTTAEDSCKTSRFLASIGQYLSVMTTIYLDLFEEYMHDEDTPLGMSLTPFVQKCKSAKCLILGLHGDYSNEDPVDLTIPPSAERIIFTYECPFDKEEEDILPILDGVLVHFLEGSDLPNLVSCTLCIDDLCGNTTARTINEAIDISETGAAHIFLRKTSELCTRKRARFVLSHGRPTIDTF